MSYYRGPQDNRMDDNHDSEPLFSDEVYQMLRVDSLLARTGSSNFASLLDSNSFTGTGSDSSVQQQQPDQQQLQQQQQEQQQCVPQMPFLHQNDPLLTGNNTSDVFTQQQQQQQQQQPPQQQYLESEVPLVWHVMGSDNVLPIDNSHGQEHLQNESSVSVLENSSSANIGDSANIADSTIVNHMPSLQPWPGQFDFDISLPTGNRDRNKWCYSEVQKKLYLCNNVAVPVIVKLKEWIDATITITPVFKDSQFRLDTVTRCYNCRNQVEVDPSVSYHVVHVEGQESDYRLVNERYLVTVPLHPPPPGEEVTTLLVKVMCLTSCVGGPNRRPFCLIFTLSNNKGVVIGRQILDVKCCKCPSRDMVNEDNKALMGHQQSVQEKDEENQVRKIATSIATSGQKRRRYSIKLEPGSEQRYKNVQVPVQFVGQVKRYINSLIAAQFVRQTQPGLFLYSEDEN